MPSEPVTDPAAPLSWRDVYRAVGDSKKDIIAAIDAAVEPLAKASEDHERRLRSIEMDGSNEAREALRIAIALGVRHDALANEVHSSASNREGMLSTLSGGQRLAVFIFGGLGALAVFLDIFNKYF